MKRRTIVYAQKLLENAQDLQAHSLQVTNEVNKFICELRTLWNAYCDAVEEKNEKEAQKLMEKLSELIYKL